MAKPLTPSVKGLLAVLKNYEQHQSTALSSLEHEAKEAENEFKYWVDNCKEYQRLASVRDEKYQVYWDARRIHLDALKRMLDKLRRQIWARGATSKMVEEVLALEKEIE